MVSFNECIFEMKLQKQSHSLVLIHLVAQPGKAPDAAASLHQPTVKLIPFPQDGYGMASLKAEKPSEKSCCSQPSAGHVKKESAAKSSSGSAKAPASKQAPKKIPSQPRKKV
ncbi:hypothetical protein VNO78_19834 [Psophocarpus tetragonolobus]|uniref:Uncharacterized protein n=1 Tax=Psophocarpus tetragonolobus TaxID=3891 RepID=A0AAN9XGZ1_PSOTE